MNDPSLERSFGFLIHDVSRLMRKRFDRRAQSIGMTRAQWSVIAHLQRRQGLNQSALADLLEIEKMTLARLLDRMEEAGWVVRRPDPADRRAKLLFLTDKVDPVWETMRRLAKEIFSEALEGIPEMEQDVLIDRLIQVKQNLTTREPAEAQALPAPALAAPGD
jgi:DNA-binding MarR family transcriptional regulator